MSRPAKVRLAVLILLALVVGWPTSTHYRMRWKVEAYRRQLKAAGEKLSFQELQPAIPADSARSARAFLDANLWLGLPYSSNMPPFMRKVAPGHAMVASRLLELPTSDSTNIWPGLSRMVAAKQEQLAALRAALAGPKMAFDLNYSQGAGLVLTHLITFKGAAQWLAAAVVLDLHEDRLTNACEGALALGRLVARSQEDPLIISELVRIAVGSIALGATWEALQYPAWRDDQLSELQATWESVDLLTQARAALAMERASDQKAYADGRRSYSAIANLTRGAATSGMAELAEIGQKLLGDPKAGLREFAHRYPGYWAWRWWQSYDDELQALQCLGADIEAVETAKRSGFVPAARQLQDKLGAIRRAHPAAGRWAGDDLVGSLDRFVSRVASFETQRSLLITAIALKRYRLRHGAYPAELSALAPEFLPQVPRDPMDHQPLRYRLNPDGSFLLYSVGEDGADDGGDSTPMPSKPRTSRQWLLGRDLVWPNPATAEMVKEDLDREQAELSLQRYPATIK